MAINHLGSPYFLFLLLIVPVIIWQYARQAGVHLGAVLFSDLSLVKKGRPATSRIFPHLPFVLLVASLILLICALARPQSGKSFKEVTSRGVDIMLCLDTSPSMQAMDFQPNRLAAAKVVSDKFIKERPHDRIGLVVFSGIALTKCPLTSDHEALLSLLSSVKFGETQTDGTAIGDALATCVNRLKNAPGKSKVIILLTDGRNNVGEISPEAAARMANAMGIKIYAIGVGTKGDVPYPVQDAFGNVQIVQGEPVDEETLDKIAQLTDGVAFRAQDNEELDGIYNQIDTMEKYAIKTRQFSQYKDLYMFFLWPGLILLLLEIVLRRSWLRELP